MATTSRVVFRGTQKLRLQAGHGKKVRGFTLNFRNSQLINFDTVVRMVKDAKILELFSNHPIRRTLIGPNFQTRAYSVRSRL